MSAPQGSECALRGECGCAQLLGCVTRDALHRLAQQLGPRSAGVAAAWRKLLERERLPTSLAAPGEEVAAMVERLESGDAPILAGGLLAMARRHKDAAAPVHQSVAALELLGEAMAAEQASSAAGLLEEDRAALRRFGWLCASLAAVAYGSVAEPSLGSLEPRAEGRAAFCGLVGATQVMRRLYARIELAARGRETALVVGESGVGKELVARAIHQASGDPERAFVAVNCAALPHELLESELFGHRRGAFSGATADHPGLVRAAEGGTLFLDEITELAPDAQAKLLRMIQERAVRAVGELRERTVAVRVVASTNRHALQAVEQGVLRRDLYYRLQRLVLEVPPLRERISDLPLLVEAFSERWRAAYDAPRAKPFSQAALECLCLYDWPGNVRELENTVFAASLAAPGPLVRVEDLPPLSTEAEASTLSGPVVSLRSAERSTIAEALRRAAGNKSLAARALGISRKQLYAKIKLYGL